MIARTPIDVSHRPARWSTGKVYPLVLLVAMAVYWATAQRTVGWQDSGEFQLRVLRGEYDSPRGLALAHPLYIAMCRPLLVFGPARLPLLMNMLSGLGMAVTLANVYLLGTWLTGRHAAGVFGAAALGLAHTAFWLATVAEVYTWAAAGLSIELVLLVWLIARPRWWKLALLGGVSGLGLALHNFALLPLPVYAVAALLLARGRQLPWWSLAVALAAWTAGAAPQGVLVVRHAFSDGAMNAIRSALFGESWAGDVTHVSARPLARAAAYVLLNWPFLSLAPVLIGWWVMPNRAGRAVGSALGAVAAIELIFAMRYPVPDQFTFLLPAYVLFGIGSAVGIDRILRMARRPRQIWLGLCGASLVLTPVLYGLTPLVLDHMDVDIRPSRRWPYRSENRYWITPWKHNENSADIFARTALNKAGTHAVIIPGEMGVPPLVFLKEAEGLGRGVQVEAEQSATLGNYATDPTGYLRRLAGRTLYVMDGEPIPIPEGMHAVPLIRHIGGRDLYPLCRLALKAPAP